MIAAPPQSRPHMVVPVGEVSLGEVRLPSWAGRAGPPASRRSPHAHPQLVPGRPPERATPPFWAAGTLVAGTGGHSGGERPRWSFGVRCGGCSPRQCRRIASATGRLGSGRNRERARRGPGHSSTGSGSARAGSSHRVLRRRGEGGAASGSGGRVCPARFPPPRSQTGGIPRRPCRCATSGDAGRADLPGHLGCVAHPLPRGLSPGDPRALCRSHPRPQSSIGRSHAFERRRACDPRARGGWPHPRHPDSRPRHHRRPSLRLPYGGRIGPTRHSI